MKKFLICLLACLMILAMVGCSADKSGSSNTPTTPNSNNSTPSTPSSPSSPSSEPTDPSQPATSEDLSLGVTTGTKYESEFIGVGFNLPENWVFYSEDEIKQLNNLTADLAGQEYLDLLKNATVIYDMMATSPSQTDNIVVNLEKVSNVLLNKLDLASNFEASFAMVKSSLENMGYRDITKEITTVTIDGETFTAMHLTASFSGLTMHQTSIAIKCNGYLASVAVTTFDEAGTAPLLENLYLVK